MWNPDPVLFTAWGMTVRWYGVMFATGLVLAAWYVWRRFRRKGYPQGYFDALMVLSFVLMFLGARLCHCLFYEPGYYLSHPVEMFFPVKRVAGEWTFTGFYGLASHGGAAGLVCAVLLLKWWKGAPALEVMDDMAIATPLAGGFIRTGNLINSEIVGGVTDVPWAFVFEAYDPLPRHPAQIYEGAFYLLLFAVMAAQFRSVTKPLIIMCAIPFSFTGAFVSLAITGMTLNVVSLVGIIMLMGVIVNNAIVMLEKIKQLHEEEGMTHYDAVVEGCKTRLRPILMTTLTTVLALIPLALGLGSGGELMQPLGITVMGGLIVGTIVTLVLIPCIYCGVKGISADRPDGRQTRKNACQRQDSVL